MKRNNAFTLIEVLLVVIILGIIIGLAAPNFSKGIFHFQLNKTADDLMSMSRWAQAMAIGQERVYAISFSNDKSAYHLVRAKINQETGEQDGFEPISGPLGRMHALGHDIDLQTDNGQIDFYPDGTIDPVTIELESNGQKTTLSSAKIRGMITRVDRE